MSLCACGCGQEIIVKPHHRWYHPRFLYGHHFRINNPMKRIEVKAKMSIRMMGKLNPMYEMLGSRNPNWHGGLSNEPYPIEFRDRLKERIRARDNYHCRLCGVPQEECLRALDVHHIDHDKENLAELNLISLCSQCNGRCNSTSFIPQFIPLAVN